MQKRWQNLGFGWMAACVALAGCGTDNGTMPGFVTPTGSGGTMASIPPVTTAAGVSGAAVGGAAGMTMITPQPTPPPPPPPAPRPMAGSGGGMSASAGTAAAGSGGAAGSVMTTGAGGAPMTAGTGVAMAGAGGAAAGSAGSSGSAGTSSSSDSNFIRGEDPTMASTAGNAKGPYATMRYTSGFADDPSFGAATIYYPTGDAKPPFACVAVVPGFTAFQSSIAAWGPFLSSHGIVTMTIDTNTTGDLPDLRASALMGALKVCSAENERSGSPLMGKVAKDHLGVAGWSMGGGGTLIAAAKNPTLKAAVSFAAWGPSGGGQNKVPSLMFEATADPLAAGMSDSFYASTPDSTPKMLFEVSGAGHDVANSPSNSGGVIGRYGLSWFKVFLEGDKRYEQFLKAGKPSITTSNFKTNLK